MWEVEWFVFDFEDFVLLVGVFVELVCKLCLVVDLYKFIIEFFGDVFEFFVFWFICFGEVDYNDLVDWDCVFLYWVKVVVEVFFCVVLALWGSDDEVGGFFVFGDFCIDVEVWVFCDWYEFWVDGV